MKKWNLGLFVLLAATLTCQAQADQSKAEGLASMAGTFQGKVHMISSDQDFGCQLSLAVSPETAPRLEGSLSFPSLTAIIQDPDLLTPDSPFLTLLEATDYQDPIRITGGDIQPAMQPSVTLPYLEHGSNNLTFGMISGSVSGNHFSGNWSMNEIEGSIATVILNRI